jgi:hypothetical protein
VNIKGSGCVNVVKTIEVAQVWWTGQVYYLRPASNASGLM